MKYSKAAILDRNGRVIGEVFDAPEKSNTIEIAGCFTLTGDPVNVQTYKISRSRKNLQKARFEQPVSKVGNFWSFHAVENDEVVY